MVSPAIVVLGGSAGAVEALKKIAHDLPSDLPAAVFVVVHMPATASSALAQILDRAGPLPATQAVDGAPIAGGRIVVAPPDHHLLLATNHVSLSHGPREHSHRPSIDALFRSAARQRGAAVIGVVLSGSLGDGAAGLKRIIQRGGVGIVQDPAEATFAAMPARAVLLARPQHVAKLDEIAPLIVAAVRERSTGETSPDHKDVHNAASSDQAKVADVAAERRAFTIGDDAPGHPSGYSCPDCGGVLWQRGDGEDIDLVCRIGHRYNLDSLVEAKRSAVEGALWAGVRALEEDSSLMRRLSQLHAADGTARDRFLESARTNDQQSALLRDLIDRGG